MMRKALTVILSIIFLPIGLIIWLVMMGYMVTTELVEEVVYRKEIQERKTNEKTSN